MRAQRLCGIGAAMSPPTTPAHDINRPPPQVRATTDKNLAQRNAKDDLAKTNLLARSGRVGGESGTAVPQLNLAGGQASDGGSKGGSAAAAQGRPPRDPRDNEIARLRQELEIARGQSMGGGRGSLGSGRRSRGSSRGNSARRGNTMAQAGGQVIQSGGKDYDRMVLVSRDGRPRVATPSQVQMAQKKQQSARRDDLNAVSNLPSY